MGEEKQSCFAGDEIIAYIEEIASAGLKPEIPPAPSSDVPKSNVPPQDKITTANEAARVDVIKGVSDLFISREEDKARQQHQLLTSIVALLTKQVRLFSFVILVIAGTSVFVCCKRADSDLMLNLFDFLKYYVGAVLVELLGLLVLIAGNIFTSDYSKVMKQVLNLEQRKKH